MPSPVTLTVAFAYKGEVTVFSLEAASKTDPSIEVVFVSRSARYVKNI